MIESLPANAEDMGSITGPGRSHMPWGNEAHEPELLSLSSTAWELQQEKPLQWEACALQLESSPHLSKPEKASMQQQRPGIAKSK